MRHKLPYVQNSQSTHPHFPHYTDIIMFAIASQITNITIGYSTVYSDADQRKHQSSASLAFVRGIHRWPVNSPHKWPVTRKMFPFDDVIMKRPKHYWAEPGTYDTLGLFHSFVFLALYLHALSLSNYGYSSQFCMANQCQTTDRHSDVHTNHAHFLVNFDTIAQGPCCWSNGTIP